LRVSHLYYKRMSVLAFLPDLFLTCEMLGTATLTGEIGKEA
jgi:hypothetical protein